MRQKPQANLYAQIKALETRIAQLEAELRDERANHHNAARLFEIARPYMHTANGQLRELPSYEWPF